MVFAPLIRQAQLENQFDEEMVLHFGEPQHIPLRDRPLPCALWAWPVGPTTSVCATDNMTRLRRVFCARLSSHTSMADMAE
jgi:hypothetical protein